MRRGVTLFLVVLSLAAGCSGQKSPNPRTVESELMSAGFRAVTPDTPEKKELVRRLPSRRLTERMHEGKRYYYFADSDGCGCVYVGGETAYRRYDELAQARDNVRSDNADSKMLRTVESNEESPPDAWFWQDQLPEYFPR
jgi:hypothetical protein